MGQANRFQTADADLLEKFELTSDSSYKVCDARHFRLTEIAFFSNYATSSYPYPCQYRSDHMPGIHLVQRGIKFNESALDSHPAHSALLGEIVTSFSMIESMIGGVYGMLRHETIEEGIEQLALMRSNNVRVEAVRKLLAESDKLPSEFLGDKLMLEILSYAEKRNKIAHGIWGTNVEKADECYRIPVKKFIPYLASIVRSGTDGTSMEKLKLLESYIETYTIASLKQIKAQGDELLTFTFKLFNTLALLAARDEGWTSDGSNSVGSEPSPS